MLRVLDLFSGIGGFSLGLERAGMITVAFCEIDAFCRRVLAKHWPGVPCFEDVATAEFQPGSADVICGGFPCQDISYAGKRAGLAGKRSGLFWEMVRAVRVVRPKFWVVENVAALSTDGLGDVLGAMADLGYDAEWDCISAGDAGAPHGRPRVWIAAADTHCQQQESWVSESAGRGQRSTEETAEAIADAHCLRKLQPPRIFGYVRRWIADGTTRAFWECDWQTKFETLRGMDDGIPTRLDRSRDSRSIGRLGNAVVPQIPELIGRALLASI